jgi:hypothetical protein
VADETPIEQEPVAQAEIVAETDAAEEAEEKANG